MIKLSTKANTLKSIEHIVKSCKILPQLTFTIEELINSTEKVRTQIIERFKGTKVIVRSSALSEDLEAQSLAGKYSSISNVIGCDQIIEASRRVANEYLDGRLDNQILIQPMVENVLMSGVLFTLDPNTGGNYYVLNYDDYSGNTNLVTSGNQSNLQTYYLFRGAKYANSKLSGLIEVADELMEIFQKDNIDIEFAIDKESTIYLLQVRPLITKSNSVKFEEQSKILKRVYDYVSNEMSSKPFVHGKSTIYGIMPDWNPAEIIGVRPKPLSMSLYKYLITDRTWAQQRENYGYKSLRSHPLMIDLGGFPYIDVRVSFNSLLPKNVNGALSEKLVNYYIDSLKRQPENHDKIEFEVVFSCYTFDIDNRMQKLLEYGFFENEIIELKHKLLNLTNDIINEKYGYYIGDLNRIECLEKRRTEILNSKINKISKIYWLVEDCIYYGTLPFAGLARAGFVAVQLLKSLVSLNILSNKDYELYISSLNTVSSKMAKDINSISNKQFLLKYGHLRPGTYDITSYRYDSSPDAYFGKFNVVHNKENEMAFKLTVEQCKEINKLMNINGLKGDVLSLFNFISAAIEGREYAKFLFSKNLSDVLELIALLGEEQGYSREEMSYVDYNVFIKLYSQSLNVNDTINQSILTGKRKYRETLSLYMPSLILDPGDVYSFHLPESCPNFITLKNIHGEVCTEVKNCKDIQGKIILLEAADPGYDWVFTCGIIGFITAYGGVNSHMAIRAGELGIPAVIGVGEKTFARLLETKALFVDCANRRMEVIQ